MIKKDSQCATNNQKLIQAIAKYVNLYNYTICMRYIFLQYILGSTSGTCDINYIRHIAARSIANLRADNRDCDFIIDHKRIYV